MAGERVNRFFGGSPLAVLFRLALLSVLVGVVLSALDIDVRNLIPRIVQLLQDIWSMGFDAVRWLWNYFLLGAIIVLPIWLIMRIFRAGGGNPDPVDIPPALADRLSKEAARLAGQFFTVCTRALDYTAPVDITFDLDPTSGSIEIHAIVRCEGKTGVEMEAMTACAVAALTIYDMCKSAEKGIVIEGLQLVRKSGGKSGTWER